VFLDQFSGKKSRHKIEPKKRKKKMPQNSMKKIELFGTSENLKKSIEIYFENY